MERRRLAAVGVIARSRSRVLHGAARTARPGFRFGADGGGTPPLRLAAPVHEKLTAVVLPPLRTTPMRSPRAGA
jgi:hypothetical protein